jgi:transcription initiation factor TFIID subunit 9B
MSGGLGSSTSRTTTSAEVLRSNDVPMEAKLVALILRSMGVEEHEPRVIPQLLEFMHRYVGQVLQDSLLYCQHAGKPPSALDLEDVRLAIQSRVNYSFTQPPPREFLLELSQNKNTIPLPFLPSHKGVRLPPPRFRVHPLRFDRPLKYPSSSSTSSSLTLDNQSTESPSSSTSTSTSSSTAATAESSSSSLNSLSGPPSLHLPFTASSTSLSSVSMNALAPLHNEPST